MRFERSVLWLIALGLGIKISLFLYIAFVNSASMMQPDSYGYLTDASAWLQYFNLPAEGLKQSLYRTPGYPFMLFIFHYVFNLPLLFIVFLQIALNVLTAFVVFKAVTWMDRRAGLLCAAIVLLDFPMTIYSTMVLTESFYVFVISLFIYAFIKYINNQHLGWLIGSLVLLVVSVYIRPIGLYLGIAVAGYVLYFWGNKKILTGIAHGILALMLVYGLLGIWQYHNLKIHGEYTFSSIDRATIGMHGVIGRYARETSPSLRAMPPPIYYTVSIGRNFLSLMSAPGSFKYFHSKVLTILGVIFGYLFVVFWWVGLIAGIRKGSSNAVGQFLLLVLFYFIFVSLISTGWQVTPRFRVPMVPSIAILSAWGWMSLLKRGAVDY